LKVYWLRAMTSKGPEYAGIRLGWMISLLMNICVQVCSSDGIWTGLLCSTLVGIGYKDPANSLMLLLMWDAEGVCESLDWGRKRYQGVTNFVQIICQQHRLADLLWTFAWKRNVVAADCSSRAQAQPAFINHIFSDDTMPITFRICRMSNRNSLMMIVLIFPLTHLWNYNLFLFLTQFHQYLSIQVCAVTGYFCLQL